jgi:hypothetical protein
VRADEAGAAGDEDALYLKAKDFFSPLFLRSSIIAEKIDLGGQEGS